MWSYILCGLNAIASFYFTSIGKAKESAVISSARGLVILLATEERAVQFATGYGLEGDLPDAICKRIQQRYMVPYFKNDDWNTGMVEGVKAVAQRLDGTMEREEEDDGDDTAAIVALSLFLGAFLLMIVILIIYEYNRSNAPSVANTNSKGNR